MRITKHFFTVTYKKDKNYFTTLLNKICRSIQNVYFINLSSKLHFIVYFLIIYNAINSSFGYLVLKYYNILYFHRNFS